jgi:hypothetical protein
MVAVCISVEPKSDHTAGSLGLRIAGWAHNGKSPPPWRAVGDRRALQRTRRALALCPTTAAMRGPASSAATAVSFGSMLRRALVGLSLPWQAPDSAAASSGALLPPPCGTDELCCRRSELRPHVVVSSAPLPRRALAPAMPSSGSPSLPN